MSKLSRSIESSSLDTLQAAGRVGVVKQEKVIRADTGGDMALSGVNAARGRGGNAKVGAAFKVEKRGASPAGVITATGPLQIINNDTSGRVIRSAYLYGRRGARRRGFVGPVLPGTYSARRGGFIGPVASQKAVLNIPGIGFRLSARHPGTTGKNTWQRGSTEARPAVTKAMQQRTFNTIKGAVKP